MGLSAPTMLARSMHPEKAVCAVAERVTHASCRFSGARARRMTAVRRGLCDRVRGMATGRRRAPWLRWSPLVLLLIVLSGCGRHDVEVLEAIAWADSTAVNLGVGSCNAEPKVEVVSQTEQAVRVRASADRSSDSCADAVSICLDEPLGDRLLVDDTTGEMVDVNAAPEAVGDPPDCQYAAPKSLPGPSRRAIAGMRRRVL